MKNLFVGLFIIGFTSLSYSQNLYSEVDKASLNKKFTSSSNSSYFQKVKSLENVEQIKSLEIIASNYDVTKKSTFKGSTKPFKLKFEGTYGYIIANYNNNGEIISTVEKFKNIALPKDIIKSISKEYPHASILRTTYFVSYNKEFGITKRYTVKIKKGNIKKNLKFGSYIGLE